MVREYKLSHVEFTYLVKAWNDARQLADIRKDLDAAMDLMEYGRTLIENALPSTLYVTVLAVDAKMLGMLKGIARSYTTYAASKGDKLIGELLVTRFNS